mmetsp:Transcript_10673/g.41437  ORF Transcript_10673/g.41437 Transcript_10673/m.41437 type:complete len:395 (+) Transcript_10673:287-1471(+)
MLTAMRQFPYHSATSENANGDRLGSPPSRSPLELEPAKGKGGLSSSSVEASSAAASSRPASHLPEPESACLSAPARPAPPIAGDEAPEASTGLCGAEPAAAGLLASAATAAGWRMATPSSPPASFACVARTGASGGRALSARGCPPRGATAVAGLRAAEPAPLRPPVKSSPLASAIVASLAPAAALAGAGSLAPASGIASSSDAESGARHVLCAAPRSLLRFTLYEWARFRRASTALARASSRFLIVCSFRSRPCLTSEPRKTIRPFTVKRMQPAPAEPAAPAPPRTDAAALSVATICCGLALSSEDMAASSRAPCTAACRPAALPRGAAPRTLVVPREDASADPADSEPAPPLTCRVRSRRAASLPAGMRCARGKSTYTPTVFTSSSKPHESA